MTCYNKFPVDLNHPKIQIDLSDYDAELLQETTIRLFSVKSVGRDVLIKSTIKATVPTKKTGGNEPVESSSSSAIRALSSSNSNSPHTAIAAATDNSLPARTSIEEASGSRARNGSITTSDASHTSNLQIPVLPGVSDGSEMTIQEWYQLIKEHIDYASINRNSFGKLPTPASNRDCLRV